MKVGKTIFIIDDKDFKVKNITRKREKLYITVTNSTPRKTNNYKAI